MRNTSSAGSDGGNSAISGQIIPPSSPPPGQQPPPPGQPPPPDPDTEGLADGYWREDGAIWMNEGSRRRPRRLRLCSDMRAVHTESSPDGVGWAVTVELINSRGQYKQVSFSCAAAETDAASCVRALVDAGLVVHTDHQKRSRLILNAVVRANVPLAYGLVRTGLTTIEGGHVFALPTGILKPSGRGPQSSVIVWRGDTQYGRMRQGGARAGWVSEVAAPAEMVPLAMASMGVMLSGPAIPFLPPGSEKNTAVHLVGDSGTGKSTIVCAGATVYGKGSQPPDPDSFLESYKNTVNQVENVLLAHNHLGICFDELKTIDQKAAQTFAYDFAMGRRKGRMNADGSSRSKDSWELPALSSGEITLSDRANEHAVRHQTMDSGADVRVQNIAAEGAFGEVGNYSERKAFVEALGAAAATHYGFVGPEFIKFLLDYEDDARRAIEKNLLIWKAVTSPSLGDAPSAQAARVASRLASLVAPAALAAEVLKLPWGADLSKFGVSTTPAAGAMFLAFVRILDTWIGSHGLMYSTQTTAILQRLRAFLP